MSATLVDAYPFCAKSSIAAYTILSFVSVGTGGNVLNDHSTRKSGVHISHISGTDRPPRPWRVGVGSSNRGGHCTALHPPLARFPCARRLSWPALSFRSRWSPHRSSHK